MRHIAISIILALIFLSSSGQTQQTLKNGFVAATDDGVWYLQDGFDEWVQIAEGRSVVINIDPSNDVPVYIPTTSDIQYYIYGKKLRSDKSGGGSDSITLFDLNLDLYHGVAEYGYRGGSGWISAYGSRDGVSYGFTMSRRDGITDLSTDNDTIVCFVGNDNQLIKYTLAKNETIINISGLHSRSTDSHQICYNPDDDEFIIVSDSGIVYSYDKTTLTTIDTIPTIYGNEIVSIEDVKYSHERNYYVIALREIKNGVPVLNTYVTTNFTSYTGEDYGGDNTATLCTGYNGYIYIIDIFGNISRITEANNQNVMPRLLNVSVFDLDYINYMP